MKVTKRQLARIIKEEKRNLSRPGELPYKIQDALDRWQYQSGEELNGILSQIDRDWDEKPEILDGVQAAIDKIKVYFEGWRQ